MIQPKKKPVVAAAAAVAPSPQTPYTAARSGKDTTVSGAEADGLAQALDRRVTEGFNLVHGRLDVIQEDVRENRRDIKELRKELWDGLREAAGDRVRLASKADLDRLGESAAADRRRVEKEAAADRARLASRADLDRLGESAAADRRRVEEQAAADRRRLEDKFDTALATFRAEVNERFATQESSQRELIAMVSKVLERTEAATWTRRRLWVAVAAGTSLLVIGAVTRPLLERAVAALLGG